MSKQCGLEGGKIHEIMGKRSQLLRKPCILRLEGTQQSSEETLEKMGGTGWEGRRREKENVRQSKMKPMPVVV